MALKTSESDSKYNIFDTSTPRHTLLSGKYKRSYAYYTLKERLPVILTHIIDNLNKDKDEIAENYQGQKTREELKQIIGEISKLKYQLQTDKNFEKFTGREVDKELWNNFLDHLDTNFSTFYQAAWLHAECYTYRKVASFFENSETLRNYDYFSKEKQNALKTDEIAGVAKSFRHTEKNQETFLRILKLNLWGNKCDVATKKPTNFELPQNAMNYCDKFNANLLVDESKSVWNCLVTADHSKPVLVDFICDNAGFELFSDLILADYMLEKQLVSKVRFHVKILPWYVTDYSISDFNYTLQFLCKHGPSYVNELGNKWKQYLADGIIEISQNETFWTSPYEYYKMRETDPELYKRLSEARLIIIKGDLNYRKLMGDMNWDATDDFLTCLRGFQPTNLCTLRLVKADVICGLEQGKSEELSRSHPRWMETGEYGVIQYMEGNMCTCNTFKPATSSD